MSRAKSKTTVSEANDNVVLHAVVPTDENLVEVAYHDGSTFTFDLHFAGRRIPFVNGKATVDASTAEALRDGGHVK